jgi:hypothetical protein
MAERQMGKFLKAMPKQAGARGIGKSGVPEENSTTPPTLAQIGVTKKQSATAQALTPCQYIEP